MEIKIRKAKLSDGEQYITLVNKVWRIAYSHIMPKEIFDEVFYIYDLADSNKK